MQTTIKILTILLSLTLMTECGEKQESGTEAHTEETTDNRKIANYRMPEDMSHLRHDLHRHYYEVFNDSNKYQFAHAEKMGIVPITDLHSSYHTSRPIVQIVDTENYMVDSLTHSLPFLVPEAAKLLSDIGEAFRDTLTAKKISRVRPVITSLLRTPASVSSLRRVNRNATDSSAHQYATTFDISYIRFASPTSRDIVREIGLKEALAEVLYDLRASNRCMVKHEVKSSCFHVTVIK